MYGLRHQKKKREGLKGEMVVGRRFVNEEGAIVFKRKG
jgi:hypothetical protein